MQRLFMAEDGTQFTSEEECLNYELKKGTLFKCLACDGRGTQTRQEFIKVKETIYDRWVGEIDVENERATNVDVPCEYCEGGFRRTPLKPKYRVTKEFIGWEESDND